MPAGRHPTQNDNALSQKWHPEECVGAVADAEPSVRAYMSQHLKLVSDIEGFVSKSVTYLDPFG